MLIGDDGKIKLDRLTGPEKEVLVSEFIHGDPLRLLWYSAMSAYDKKGARRSSILKEIRETPEFTLWCKLMDSGVIDCEKWKSAEKWLAELDVHLKRRKK